MTGIELKLFYFNVTMLMSSALSKTATAVSKTWYCEDPELKRNVSANIAVDRRQGAPDPSTELSNKDYPGTATRGEGELCPCCDVLRHGG